MIAYLIWLYALLSEYSRSSHTSRFISELAQTIRPPNASGLGPILRERYDINLPTRNSLTLSIFFCSFWKKGQGEEVNLSSCIITGTVRVLLIKFLRELPDSLIPKNTYSNWMEAYG